MFTLSNQIPRNNHPTLLPYLNLLPHNLTATATATAPPPPPQDETTIANLVLKSDPKTLTTALENHPVQWTPELVTRVLKRLWNHGPKALQFFKTLDRHHSYTHSSAAFDHAVDIAARLRDYKTLWTLVASMQTRRLGPTPKTFAIITESGKGARKRKLKLLTNRLGVACGCGWHKMN